MKNQKKNQSTISSSALHATRYAFRGLRGFTITEVIVVVGVMTLLLGVGVGYTQKGGKQIVLFREHAQLTQQILRARSFATQKLRPGEERVCGYGISLGGRSADGRDEYSLFKDLPQGSCPGSGVMEGGEMLETFTIDKAVNVLGYSHADFVFAPPDGFLYFKGVRARPDEDPAFITLDLAGTGQSISVNINYLGQVYTE